MALKTRHEQQIVPSNPTDQSFQRTNLGKKRFDQKEGQEAVWAKNWCGPPPDEEFLDHFQRFDEDTPKSQEEGSVSVSDAPEVGTPRREWC